VCGLILCHINHTEENHHQIPCMFVLTFKQSLVKQAPTGQSAVGTVSLSGCSGVHLIPPIPTSTTRSDIYLCFPQSSQTSRLLLLVRGVVVEEEKGKKSLLVLPPGLFQAFSVVSCRQNRRHREEMNQRTVHLKLNRTNQPLARIPKFFLKTATENCLSKQTCRASR
jgi:hypothetical protein